MISRSSKPPWGSTTRCIVGVAMRHPRPIIGLTISREPDVNDAFAPRMAAESKQIPSHGVSLHEAFWTWMRVAALSFGGPAGQIAVMHKALVEEKRWISEERFLHALNYCMLLPGPEAQQLAIYIGWLLHRTIGGIVAGVFFVLPSVFILLALSWIYAVHGNLSWVDAFFYGLKPAVVAIVAEAVIRIGKKTLKNGTLMGVAAAAFIAIYVFEVPFPLIVISAGFFGFAGSQMLPGKFALSKAVSNS